MPSVFQHIFYLLWQTLLENYKNICDSCWYYFLCIPWTSSGFISNTGMLFSQFEMSHQMIMSPCVNANHVLSYLCWKAIFKFYWFIWYLTIKQFFLIVWTIWTYVCVSNFISIQNWSAICIISKTTYFFISYEPWTYSVAEWIVTHKSVHLDSIVHKPVKFGESSKPTALLRLW